MPNPKTDLRGDGLTLDITIWREYGKDLFAQARYLVHGYDDVMWANDLEAAMQYLQQEAERITSEMIGERP